MWVHLLASPFEVRSDATGSTLFSVSPWLGFSSGPAVEDAALVPGPLDDVLTHCLWVQIVWRVSHKDDLGMDLPLPLYFLCSCFFFTSPVFMGSNCSLLACESL